jgi:hypothetical protein
VGLEAVNGLTSFPHTTRGCMWLLRRSNGVSKSGYGPLGLGSIVSYPSHGHHPIQLLSSPSLLSSFLTEEILFLQERVPNPHYINSLLRRPKKITSPSSSSIPHPNHYIHFHQLHHKNPSSPCSSLPSLSSSLSPPAFSRLHLSRSVLPLASKLTFCLAHSNPFT